MTGKHISVGVIIPTYNRAQRTVDAVASVLNQTVPVERVIVVDDGSDEDIYRNLQDLLSDKRVELVRINHSGHPGIAREAGRLLLDTEWIAFLDSDDSWREDKIERVFINQNKYGADAICSLASGNSASHSEKGNTRFLSRKELFRANLIINSSVVIRSKLLEEVSGIATSYSVRGCEDYATWLRVNDKSNWLIITEELINYEDNSLDSVRQDEEFRQDYSNVAALLDYVLFSRENSDRKFLPLRLYLKLLWRLVK